MEGINFIEDKDNNKRFVQIDLSIHGELWADFYDLLLIEQRKNEETIPFETVLKKLNQKKQVKNTTRKQTL